MPADEGGRRAHSFGVGDACGKVGWMWMVQPGWSCEMLRAHAILNRAPVSMACTSHPCQKKSHQYAAKRVRCVGPAHQRPCINKQHEYYPNIPRPAVLIRKALFFAVRPAGKKG